MPKFENVTKFRPVTFKSKGSFNQVFVMEFGDPCIVLLKNGAYSLFTKKASVTIAAMIDFHGAEWFISEDSKICVKVEKVKDTYSVSFMDADNNRFFHMTYDNLSSKLIGWDIAAFVYVARNNVSNVNEYFPYRKLPRVVEKIFNSNSAKNTIYQRAYVSKSGPIENFSFDLDYSVSPNVVAGKSNEVVGWAAYIEDADKRVNEIASVNKNFEYFVTIGSLNETVCYRVTKGNVFKKS